MVAHRESRTQVSQLPALLFPKPPKLCLALRPRWHGCPGTQAEGGALAITGSEGRGVPCPSTFLEKGTCSEATSSGPFPDPCRERLSLPTLALLHKDRTAESWAQESEAPPASPSSPPSPSSLGGLLRCLHSDPLNHESRKGELPSPCFLAPARTKDRLDPSGEVLGRNGVLGFGLGSSCCCLTKLNKAKGGGGQE